MCPDSFSTGFPYPLPWGKIPENISCYLTSKQCQSHPKVQALNQARYAHGIKPDPLGSFTPFADGVPQITPSLPAVDLPMSNIPSNVFDCGPILVASPPIESSDPDLLAWLKRAPTVLVSLGTHFEAYAETVREQAIGLRVLLEARPDIQVLWKLKREATSEKSGQENLDSILGQFIESGRVRIESWLNADPVAILRSGHIACSVHHGGANSYFEATWYVSLLLLCHLSSSTNLMRIVYTGPAFPRLSLPCGTTPSTTPRGLNTLESAPMGTAKKAAVALLTMITTWLRIW